MCECVYVGGGMYMSECVDECLCVCVCVCVCVCDSCTVKQIPTTTWVKGKVRAPPGGREGTVVMTGPSCGQDQGG